MTEAQNPLTANEVRGCAFVFALLLFLIFFAIVGVAVAV